jgi:hypothetical protein
MRTRSLAFIAMTAVAAILAAVTLRAAVTVTPTEPPKENTEPPKTDSSQGKLVALRVSESQYVTTGPNGSISIGGSKIGSKQMFAIIDLSGGNLGDGDEVKIRYTPGGSNPDPSKANYWVERPGGVKRTKEGDVFKIKKMGTKYAFQTPSGKFLTGTFGDVTLTVSDKKESALLVEFVDLSSGIPKYPKKSMADAPPVEKPAAE